MARYQVILAYDGTDFSGFQRQAIKKDSRTVQSEVENALRQIGWQGKSILAAGRTDAGVHASGQVIAFDLDWSHGQSDLLAAMNANLPADVAVSVVRQADEFFHPRFAAQARRYRYRIICSPLRDPLKERFAWRVWPAVNLERMIEAADLLPGTHDFCAFGSPPSRGGTTIRTIYRAGWWSYVDSDGENEFVFEITGNAFLYRMVRRLVSYQVRIGQGELETAALAFCLETGTKQLVKGLAPAQGLSLVEVIYPDPAETVAPAGELSRNTTQA